MPAETGTFAKRTLDPNAHNQLKHERTKLMKLLADQALETSRQERYREAYNRLWAIAENIAPARCYRKTEVECEQDIMDVDEDESGEVPLGDSKRGVADQAGGDDAAETAVSTSKMPEDEHRRECTAPLANLR